MYGVQFPPKFNFWILLVFLAFDVVVLQFVPSYAIEHSSFQFLYFKCRFDIVSRFNIQVYAIQHSSLRNSTFKFTQFNIQVYAIQHSSLRNSTFKFTQFNIQVYAIQHSSLRNSTSKFTQFNIQVYAIQHPTFEDACFRYPTASQSMTIIWMLCRAALRTQIVAFATEQILTISRQISNFLFISSCIIYSPEGHRKAIAKFPTLRLQSYFIHRFLM